VITAVADHPPSPQPGGGLTLVKGSHTVNVKNVKRATRKREVPMLVKGSMKVKGGP